MGGIRTVARRELWEGIGVFDGVVCVIVPQLAVLFFVQLFCIGDKSRAQIARDYKEAMTLSVDSCFDKDAIFPLVSAMTAGTRGVRTHHHSKPVRS